MSEPIILSDEEDYIPPSILFHSVKKRRTGPGPGPNPNPTVLILDDDDLTPHQSTASTSTPYFESPSSDIEVLKCTRAPSGDLTRVHGSGHKSSGIDGLICLESDDDDSESGSGGEKEKENESITSGFGMVEDLDLSYRGVTMTCSLGLADLADIREEETKEAKRRKKMTKDERAQLMEEKKLKKLQQEKMQREALKAEAADMKKIQKEKQRWEKGKFALKSIVAEIDCKVVELGSLGGNLLTRFAERGLSYRIKANPIERSIVWTMTVPEHFSQLFPEGIEIQYVLLVYESEEFCNLVIKDSLLEHIARVRSIYPSYTVCYLMNRSMAMYINNREQEAYKNQTNIGRTYPTAKEVELEFAKFTTNFFKVHSRQCRDEVELAEHVVGLTCSLSTCKFRKKLTRLDVNANGALITKDRIDRDLLKNNLWLRALVAIPKVQPRFAKAIWKKYPTMKSLLSVYMDPIISVHEKEFLLKDLTTEGLLGGDRKVGEVCSKRVYRVLMAQHGCVTTDDIEDGANFFGS
ncbi:crossover junction endonuclease EME1B-like isoform X3 [Rosa rugosa]|uniref:crossover junction endonuclease EME1B-like isoform X3 n=1 Tax=Rosa rugosa TaxID=74645 RepID=UPI002B411AA4|nr:crossover junction endonuclease EME1B-like isoform X3 [Rosa rugosa]